MLVDYLTYIFKQERTMGYSLVTPRAGKLPLVTWNISAREDGKPYPTRKAVYLGLLDTSSNELLRAANDVELTDEMINDLRKKGVAVGEGKAPPRGRAAQFIRRIPIGGVGESCVIAIGYYRVVHHYAKSSGFLDALEGAFGNKAEALFALMAQRLDSNLGCYLARDWAEGSPFEKSTMSLSPSACSALLGGVEARRLDFSRLWYKACGSPTQLLEDSTHFCTRSTGATRRQLEEFGWTHHQENGLRQLNVMSLIDKNTKLPVMYRAYPGSINDISTFMETSEEMRVIGADVSREYVSDSGYFSNFNMAYMLRAGDGFTIEANWDGQTERILVENEEKLRGNGVFVMHSGLSYRYEKCSYTVTDKTTSPATKKNVMGYIYYSELEHSRKKNEFLAIIEQWRVAFGKYDFTGREQAQEWIATSTDGWGRYLTPKGSSSADLVVDINFHLLEKFVRKLGFHIVLCTDAGRGAADVLDTVHSRDPVEKLWHTMKSELDARTLRTKLDDTTLGQVFVVWGAAVLHRMLLNAIERHSLNMSVNELLLALNKAKLTVSNGMTIAKTATKKFKEAVVKLELENIFREFSVALEPLVKAREDAKARLNKPKRGRPQKFKLKQ
jgi:hypothetical protein